MNQNFNMRCDQRFNQQYFSQSHDPQIIHEQAAYITPYIIKKKNKRWKCKYCVIDIIRTYAKLITLLVILIIYAIGLLISIKYEDYKVLLYIVCSISFSSGILSIAVFLDFFKQTPRNYPQLIKSL